MSKELGTANVKLRIGRRETTGALSGITLMPWISVGRGHVLVSIRSASELKALPISSRPLLTTNRGLGFWYPPCRMTGIRLFAFAKRLAHLVPVWPDYFSTRRRDSCFLMRAVDARSSATHICGTATSVLFARYPPPFPAIRLSMQTACRPMCVCVCVCAYPRARAHCRRALSRRITHTRGNSNHDPGAAVILSPLAGCGTVKPSHPCSSYV